MKRRDRATGRTWAGVGAVTLLLCAGAATADPAAAPAPVKLRVLVDADPPFAVLRGDRWEGWAIDLWTEVAAKAGLEWEIVGTADRDAIVDALAARRVDVGVGDVSVTKERAARIDFSHPFFNSGFRILTRSGGDESIAGALAALLTPAHLRLAAGVAGLLAAMSALIYLLARRHDAENFPEGRAEGIVEAVYIAAGALLKGSLDRKLLPGVFARVLTIVWMFFGTAVVAYVTAAVAAVITVHRLSTPIQSIDDLVGRPVAVVAGTFSLPWLAQRGLVLDPHPNVDEAIHALTAGRAVAVVHDAPVLAWWVSAHPNADVVLVGHQFKRTDYAFALQDKSPLRVPINVALLDLEESGFFAELDRRWLGGR